MSYSSAVVEELRYLKYSLPFISFFFYISYKPSINNQESDKYLTIFIKFYAILFISFFVKQVLTENINFRFFANTYFVLAPLVFIYYLSKLINPSRVYHYFIFFCIGSIIGYLIEKGSGIVSTLSNISILFLGLEDSSVDSESHTYTFVFLFLFIYSFTNKFSKSFSFLLFCFFLLGFKRIAIGAAAVFFVLHYFDKIFSIDFVIRNKRKYGLLFSCFATILIIIYFKISNGDFDQFVYENYGLSVDFILMGRQKLYSIAVSHATEYSIFFGLGIGTIDEIITNTFHHNGVGLKNLHSELLKFYLEIGAIFYIIWIYIFFINSARNRYSILSFIVLFITLLTDNVFIYFDCMMTFYLLNVFHLKTSQVSLISPHKKEDINFIKILSHSS